MKAISEVRECEMPEILPHFQCIPHDNLPSRERIWMANEVQIPINQFLQMITLSHKAHSVKLAAATDTTAVTHIASDS